MDPKTREVLTTLLAEIRELQKLSDRLDQKISDQSDDRNQSKIIH